jgi:hypothetical protein
MSFIVYLFVLLITAGSVAFGLDWLHAPMSPMPASKYELHAAKAPELPKPAIAEVKALPAPPPAPAAVVAPPAAPAPAPIVAPEPVIAAAPPKCDINACAAAYRSFTASDCTYQPSDGPRRLCTKGHPPSAAAAATAPAAHAQATCNVDACSAAYRSFIAADCTYQPLEGPRRLCEK